MIGYIFDTRTREDGPPPVWGVDGRLLPPVDAAGDVFSCCSICAAAPLAERCSGCPRGSYHLPGPFGGPSERTPNRRRWWRRRRNEES